MRTRRGCGLLVFGALFVMVACLIFVALSAGLVYTGELPLYTPRLTGLQPEPRDPFRPSTPITLTFDQPMDRASVEAAFMLEPTVPGSYRWNEESTQVTFVPSNGGYEPGTTYTARLEATAKAGTFPRTMTRAVEWHFTLPPLLDALDPMPGAKDLGALPELQASFHYPLDCRATFQAFSIRPDAVGLLGCKDSTLTFSPTQSLSPGTTYVASLENVYLEGDPWPRAGVRWEFGTAPPLAIEGVEPPSVGFLSDLWAPFRITFNRPVVADTALARFSLVTRDGIPVAGQPVWEQNGAILVFQPEEALKPATEYQLAVRNGVMDELGFELTETVVQSYATPPMLGLPLPIPDSAEVALNSEIRVPFTRPMDKASVEAGVEILPALDTVVSWDQDTLVLTPRGGLAPETVYQVSLSAGIRDATGAPLAEAREWTFSTQPFLLEALMPDRPVVTELQTPIELTFALPMDRVSVRAALIVSPTTPGELIWSNDDRTVTYQPDPGWLSGVDYEILLSGDVRTADGAQALDTDLIHSFSTAQAEVRFGQGPNVQVIGTVGERAFQVVAQGADVADFRLYAITSTQFLDLYSSGFRGIGPEEVQILDTSALTPTVQWREALRPLGDQLYGDWRPAEAHLPSDVAPGVYILSAEPPSEQQGQLIVVLSRHSLVLKRALAGTGSRTQAQVIAWDTEISDVAPVVSATLRLYDRDGTLLTEGVTDAGGLLALDLPGDPAPLLALADADGDLTVGGLGNEWSEGGWWWWWTPAPSRPLYLTYSYTDRPIYRPSQTIHFKHFVRADDDVSYTLPPPELPVTVRLRDARDNIAATQVLTPTEFGTVHGLFQLADEPPLGTWNLETEVEGAFVRQPLEVEEYRKPEYKVTVFTDEKTYVQGEAISVTVDANYYFGQPVSAAEVQLLAYPIYPDLFEAEDEVPFGYPIFAEEGQTDADGKWVAVLPSKEVTEPGTEAHRVLLALEATVTDDTGQSVSNYQTVFVQPASQGLALVLEQHGYQPGQEIAFSAIVRDRQGEPVGGVEVTAHVIGWDENEVTTATAFTDGTGKAGFSVILTEQGWYRLLLKGLDDGGREVWTEDYVWVYDPTGQSPWYGGDWGGKPALTVSSDRETYSVGDEAQVIVYTPQPGPALLSFERGETRYAEPITLISGTNLISIPIRADYAPNIHVTINQFGPASEGRWQDQSRPEAQLHTASAQLLVPMNDRLLTVTLTADQEAYAPGDQATFQVQVTDYQGQPVIAQVSLAVVDEAIYALVEDESRDPFEAFYGPRPNLVRTFDSLRPTRWLVPEGPGLGGDGEQEGGAPRRDFLDTAYWAPSLVTGETGEATIAFELPDNLTEWRVLARAVTTGTLVGQATARIVVSQDIAVQPVLPRFLVQGDSADLAAVVHNSTSQSVSATLRIELEGLTLNGDTSQVIHVPAGDAATATWPVTAGESVGDLQGEPVLARISIRTTASRGTRLVGRDAVELFVPVHPLAVAEPTTWAGELAPAWPTDTIALTVPADVITSMSHLEINLAPSLAPGLLEGLEYLVDFPYGCVEQTMSRVLPNAMVARAFAELDIPNERLDADLPPMVDIGLQKLYGYQHNDGGWGWWYDDSTDVNQTAYVLFGLTMTEQAGFDVDDSVMERGIVALRSILPNADPRAQAYGTYVLAMAGQPVTLTLTLTDALQLDLFSQAALAVGLGTAGDWVTGVESSQAMVAALLDNLRESAIQDGTTVHWQEEGENIDYSRTVMGSTERTTAMTTDALLRLEPTSPLLPGAVRWLMSQRQGQGWGDTQKTSYAIMALTDYLLVSQDLAAGSAFQVSLNGELWEQGELEQAEASETLTVPLAALLPAENVITLMLGAEGGAPSGRLYYAATLDLNRPLGEGGLPDLRADDRSIGVQREYRLQGSQEPVTQFQKGDLVEVHLTLDVPAESWFVVLEDHLPAGFEALNERLNTTSHVATAYEEPLYSWKRYGYNRKDVRDHRVSFFIQHLETGTHTFMYLVRTTTSGSFVALPAQVYPMYEPEVWSRSGSASVQIQAR